MAARNSKTQVLLSEKCLKNLKKIKAAVCNSCKYCKTEQKDILVPVYTNTMYQEQQFIDFVYSLIKCLLTSIFPPVYWDTELSTDLLGSTRDGFSIQIGVFFTKMSLAISTSVSCSIPTPQSTILEGS